MTKKFLVTSLIAAGFPVTAIDASVAPWATWQDQPTVKIFSIFRQAHTYTLAGHSSHRSHGSHSSHRSSSQGYRSPSSPAPLYTPPLSDSTPPSSILPSPPKALRTLPGNTAAFTNIAIQVQVALTAHGYYSGPIDGIIGSASRAALSKFQADYSLRVTGTITPEVLDAMGIVAK